MFILYCHRMFMKGTKPEWLFENIKGNASSRSYGLFPFRIKRSLDNDCGDICEVFAICKLNGAQHQRQQESSSGMSHQCCKVLGLARCGEFFRTYVLSVPGKVA